MAKAAKKDKPDSLELMEAIEVLEKEKNISKDVLMEAIEKSLLTACHNHFGTTENIDIEMNRDTGEYHVYQIKKVVDEVEDPNLEISTADAKMIDDKLMLGDDCRIEVRSKDFGRIATQNAKNVILQKIREEERKSIVDYFSEKEKTIMTGIVQRDIGNNVSINLGKADAILTRKEMIRGENFKPMDRVRVYIVEVKNTNRGARILVSRTHPDFVRCLFEEEVSEIRDGIVEIKNIVREPGSRTKMSVWSNDADVDPVGACVGKEGSRVNAVVTELHGEKIDIVNWDINPAILIQNALSPAKVISVIADEDEKKAKVVVPDYQLSLAIGKEGQNARLAARLTGYKIDIKSETQARERGDFMELEEEYYEDEFDTDEDDFLEDSSGIADDLDDEGYISSDFADGDVTGEEQEAAEEEETEAGEFQETEKNMTDSVSEDAVNEIPDMGSAEDGSENGDSENE